MRLRNNIFAAAFDYLKREKGIKTQKRLAELMGVSEDTITRIMKDRTEVTEDIITKTPRREVGKTKGREQSPSFLLCNRVGC